MSPEDPRHGIPAGYDAHLRAGQKACDPCRAAAAEYEYRRRIDSILGRERTKSSAGTARRIQALVALGYTFGQIGEALERSQDWTAKLAHRRDGIVRADTAGLIDGLYQRWCMTPPTATTSRERWAASYARSTAKKHGWVPPLAWDDIDSDERPNLGSDDTDVDPVVVERLMDGQSVESTRAEKVEAMRQWLALGRSERSLCMKHGWAFNRYVEREVA